jgi:hypothetical protein
MKIKENGVCKMAKKNAFAKYLYTAEVYFYTLHGVALFIRRLYHTPWEAK